jgi:(R,R)-butanediol dehydrogenase/meso-butanediol dehydrogenase/diacetyl reductase
MKALMFSTTVPQWIALKTLGVFSKGPFYKGPLATVKLKDIPEPKLPGDDWVKIQTLITGFCASDLNLLLLKDSPSASPFTSFPCVMGHEICGKIAEKGPNVDNLEIGDVVTIAPALTCETRGFDPVCPACASGMFASCERYGDGDLAPGMFIGICKDTSGGFAPYFVAHKSQLFKLPDGAPPEVGALIEPFTVGLQTVMNNRPEKGEKVLVIGGGVIGSLIIRALKALDVDCEIIVAEFSPFAAEISKQAGADRIISDGDLYKHTVEITGASRYKPMIGPDILMGGFNRIYDTVGSTKTLNTAMRCLAAEGTLSVVGIGHDVKLDLTPLWLKMQTLKGVYACSYHEYKGEKRHMFDIALEMVAEGKVDLTGLITHKFALEDFEQLIRVNMAKSAHKALKTAITFLPQEAA